MHMGGGYKWGGKSGWRRMERKWERRWMSQYSKAKASNGKRVHVSGEKVGKEDGCQALVSR